MVLKPAVAPVKDNSKSSCGGDMAAMALRAAEPIVLFTVMPVMSIWKSV